MKVVSALTIMETRENKFQNLLLVNRTANVLIEVETNGLSEFAPCKDDVAANMDTDTTWGDHLFFEMRSLVSVIVSL